MKKLGIYIHIPFCIKKCNYCDFYSISTNEDGKRAYVEALKKEVEYMAKKSENYEVYTIYFGGGTPSILSATYISEILELIIKNFKVHREGAYPEITIECNPKTVDEGKLQIYKKSGINRISIGLQSTNDEELKLLGRIHNYKDFLESYDLTRKVGFNNVNIDIISAVPEQTLEGYEKSLDRVIALNPEHISSYSLIIEEGTPFFEKYSENAPFYKDLPDENVERAMYELTVSKLLESGYDRYEISNYAKKGFISRHNTAYWNRTEYLGLGVGASSFFKGKRYKNISNVKEYIKRISGKNDIRENIKKLTLNESMEEFMFLGLRLTDGIKKECFKNNFNKNIEEIYGDIISKHINNGLLIDTGEHLKLSEKGFDVSNYVLCDFLIG